MNRFCVRVVITGRVQGVFFRKTGYDLAVNLGLTGFIRNLSDGSVGAIVCGEKSKVAQFINWCYSGSPMARVDSVDIEELDGENSYPNFSIR